MNTRATRPETPLSDPAKSLTWLGCVYARMLMPVRFPGLLGKYPVGWCVAVSLQQVGYIKAGITPRVPAQ
jgi:hypothetical protein